MENAQSKKKRKISTKASPLSLSLKDLESLYIITEKDFAALFASHLQLREEVLKTNELLRKFITMFSAYGVIINKLAEDRGLNDAEISH